MEPRSFPKQELLDALRPVSERFRSLQREADIILKRVTIAATEQAAAKLGEAAKLIKQLPESIRPVLGDIDSEPKRYVMGHIQAMAGEAERVLVRGGLFGLGTLLVSRGSRDDDPNALERLIAHIEAA